MQEYFRISWQWAKKKFGCGGVLILDRSRADGNGSTSFILPWLLGWWPKFGLMPWTYKNQIKSNSCSAAQEDEDRALPMY